MIFTFNEYLDYNYKIKNNLDVIPKNSKKFKEYKKNLRGTEPDVIKMKTKIIKPFANNINTQRLGFPDKPVAILLLICVLTNLINLFFIP